MNSEADCRRCRDCYAASSYDEFSRVIGAYGEAKGYHEESCCRLSWRRSYCGRLNGNGLAYWVVDDSVDDSRFSEIEIVHVGHLHAESTADGKKRRLRGGGERLFSKAIQRIDGECPGTGRG